MKINKTYVYFAGGILIGGAVLFLAAKLLAKRLGKKLDLSLFDSPDQPGSGQQMDKAFLEMLKRAEKYAGFSFSYNSGFRSKTHNQIVGGVPNSAHTNGQAVDIKAATIQLRDKIVWAAKKAGFKRIGIGRTFVHLDNDATKPQYVAWGYPSGSPAPYNPFG